MGLGSYFLLINATPWTLTKSVQEHSYQMPKWQWPATFAPGQSVRVYMESKNDLIYGQDDGGEVSYRLGSGTGSEFEILYHGHKNADPTVKVDWKSLHPLNNPVGSTIGLQWHHDANAPLILAAPKSSKDPSSSLVSANNPPMDWMASIYNRISCLTLRELALPGSHDAGMSEFNQGSGAASGVNTETQNIGIDKQLQNGARWFDIRPVISGGRAKTGHYGYGVGMWHGGNGQDLSTIVKQINDFTANNKELIILDVSHGQDTDHWGGEHDDGLTQDQWNVVLNELKNLNSRIVLGNVADITTIPLSRLNNGRAGVLIVVRDDKTRDGKKIDLSAYPGMLTDSQFPLYNSYSDTNDQNKMIDDQLKKMASQRTSPTSQMFALSWTVTQSNFVLSIIKNAEAANNALPELLWPKISPQIYPNILMVDAYPENRDIAALAMAININLAKEC